MKKILSSKKSKIILFAIIGVILIGIAVFVSIKVINKNKVFTMSELALQSNQTNLSKIKSIKITEYKDYNLLPTFLNVEQDKEKIDEILNLMNSTKFKKVNDGVDYLPNYKKQDVVIGIEEKKVDDINFSLTDTDGHTLTFSFINKTNIVRGNAIYSETETKATNTNSSEKKPFYDKKG
ncbi:MAG: hypothetical protein RSA99_03015, partial [Oscillospiraceae bacterium]